MSLDFGGAFGYFDNGTLSPNPSTGAASCPSGYATTKVCGTTNLDWSVVFCLRLHTPNSDQLFDFGGMWGFVEGVSKPNPFTGGQSCPAGYTDQVLFGTLNLDWPLHVCYKVHAAGTIPGHLLGGVWGYIDGGTLVPNPATNAASCPSDYVATQVSGATDVDWPIYFCR